VAYFIFNVDTADTEQASGLLRNRVWSVGREERHRDALAPGDRALVYLAAPERSFIGCVELSSAVHEWTVAESLVVRPDTEPAGVSLSLFEEWSPPVPMADVLPRIDRSEGARADFEAGVVAITRSEYEIALAVAAEQAAGSVSWPQK